MPRKALRVFLALALLAWPEVLPAQSVADPDVAKGIRLVDDGDYDAAIFTLDAAVRRLAADPSHPADLPQAYLYLGIAFVGKGHEAAAKAKFREALKQIRDLTLSADRFPPKVINLFEAAREEIRQEPSAAAPSPAPKASSAPAAQAPQKKGGGSKGLIILGVVGAGGAVAALAAGAAPRPAGRAGAAASSPRPSPTRSWCSAGGATS